MSEQQGGISKKRPRTDEGLADLDDQADLLLEKVKQLVKENQRLRVFEEQKKNVEEEKKKVEEEKKNVEEEKKNVEEMKMELTETLEELRGLIECPVCLVVPRDQRPVPVCRNGHIVCRPCKDRIILEAGEGQQAKCPSCMVDLGNATSLIASRLVEKVEHECENDGCGEMFKLSQLVGHQDICLFRKVRCPGRGVTCNLQLPFNKVKEHLKDCPDTSENNNTWAEIHTQEARDSDKFCYWKTKAISAHDRLFFVKHRKENSIHYYEALMLGSEEECMGYQASITIQKPGQNTYSKHFARNVSNPRPIDLQSWGVMGLTLPQKALSGFLIPNKRNFQCSITLSIEKL